MQTKTKRRLVGAVSLSALALGMIAAMDASAAIATQGIATTRHNLGTSNRNASGLTTPSGSARVGDLYQTGTDEICVFCHTPHGSQSTNTLNMPIWNKAVPTSTYTVYTSGTMQGTAVVSSANKNPSLACLSCHDGTQAMDNMINSPGGSGYVSAPGARLQNTAATASIGAWSNTSDTTNGVMQQGAGVVMLGTDLSNDHPIGMAYCGGGASVSGSNAGCADMDFKAPSTNGSGFYVGTAPTQRNNMRIYGTALSTATVECASCHDPHNDINKTFLRTSNAGSGVCLTCHAK